MLGIEDSWDAVLARWEFYEVSGCDADVLLDFEGQLGSCGNPIAVACVDIRFIPFGDPVQIIRPAKILFDVNHRDGHHFTTWGPNWQRAITAHEWAHMLGLDDHLNPNGTEQDMCVINSVVGGYDLTRKATDNPCYVGPTSADIGSVLCKVYGCHPKGSLVQVPSGAVYFLQGNQKRHIPSPPVLDSWSDLSDIIPISESEGKAYLNGSDVGFRPGKLIAYAGDVYFITNEGGDWYRGHKRHVTSSAFSQCFSHLSPITYVDKTHAGIHLTGAPITGCSPRPNGFVGYVQGDAVYVIQGGLKRHVISQEVQNSWFFGPDLAPFPNIYNPGSAIGFRPGRLISSGGAIYFVTNEGDFGRAIKRHVADPTTHWCLFGGEPVIPTDAFGVNNHPTGPPIQIPAC